MKFSKYLILFVFSLILSFPLVYSIPIIPGESGFGIETPAGRGGDIYKVTNLNPSGPGSLRECTDEIGPRICVFEVSGTIELTSDIIITNPYITIAGQTAPSPGITIKGAGVDVRTSNVLIQHLRIRVGDEPDGPPYEDRDSLSVTVRIPNVHIYNVVLDHTSISWAVDEVFSTWSNWGSVNNVTLINSILSEGLWHSYHPSIRHSMGALLGRNTNNLFFSKNIMAFNNYRNPLVRDDIRNVSVINNYIHNPGRGYKAKLYVGTRGPNDVPLRVDFIGNAFYFNDNDNHFNALYIEQEAVTDLKVYLYDNIVPEYVEGDQWSVAMGRTDQSVRAEAKQITVPRLEEYMASSEVKEHLLINAGARPLDRDPVDERIINNIKTKTGSIIDSQDEVGGWPELPVNKRKFVVPENPHEDSNGDGYTNIENLLHNYSYWVEKNILAHPQFFMPRENYKVHYLFNEFNPGQGITESFENLTKITLSNTQMLLLQDVDYLYIIANINDSNVNIENNIWDSDGLEFVFDMGNRIKKIYAGPDNRTGGAFYENQEWKPMPTEIELSSYEKENGYYMKIKIPWNELGLQSNNFNRIGFDANFRSMSASGELKNTYWSSTSEGFPNPHEYGVIIISNKEITLREPISTNQPPQIINSVPSGDVFSNVTSLKLEIETDVKAFCRYDSRPNIHYLDMRHTFAKTASRTHNVNLENLTDGTQYTYYVRCRDFTEEINYNRNDYIISFKFNLEVEQEVQSPTEELAEPEEKLVEEEVLPIETSPILNETTEKNITNKTSSTVNETTQTEEKIIVEPEPARPSSGGGGGGGGGGGSSTTTSNVQTEREPEEEIIIENKTETQDTRQTFTVTNPRDKDVCLPNFQYSSWSECVMGERERTVRDLNGCHETKLERSFCSTSRDEIENMFLNSKEIELNQTEKQNYFVTNLEASYNEIISTNRYLGNQRENPVIIYDSKSSIEYLALLVNYDETTDTYFYSLRKIDDTAIPTLKAEGIIEKTTSEIVEEKKNAILGKDYILDVFRGIIYVLLFGGIVYAVTHVRWHHRVHLNHNHFSHHFKIKEHFHIHFHSKENYKSRWK